MDDFRNKLTGISPRNVLLHFTFIPLFVLAYYFHEQRIFHEAASDIFWLLNVKTLYFVHNRFVLFFSQWLPMLGINLGASLRTVIVFYSCGIILFHYSLFAFCLHYLKDHRAALSIILANTIVVLYTFFNIPMAEMWFGTSLLITFYAMLRTKKYQSLTDLILFVTVTFFTAHSHPDILLLMPFVVLFDWLESGKKSNVLYAFLAIFWVIGAWNTDEYEVSKISDYYTVESVFSNYLNPTFWWDQIRFLGEIYTTFSLLLLSSLVYYLFYKQFKKFLLLVTFFLAYFIIINHHAGIITDDNSGGLEVYYIPMVVLATIPFMYDVYGKISLTAARNVIFLVLVGIALFDMTKIAETGMGYVKRVEMIKRLIHHAQQLPGDKFYIRAENIKIHNPMVAFWTYPVESILLSALEGKENTVNITPVDVVYYDKYKDSMNATMFHWLFGEPREYNYLNPRYFELAPGAYSYLNSAGTGATDYTKVELRITDTKDHYAPFKSCHNSLRCKEQLEYIKVQIINKNGQPLPSGLESQVYLSYQWFENGEPLNHDKILSPLEVDVLNSYTQDVVVKMPEFEGTYELRINLVEVPEPEMFDYRTNFIPAGNEPNWVGNGAKEVVKVE